VSRALGGSCSVPLAAHATWQGDRLVLDVALGNAAEPLSPLLRASLAAAVDGTAAARQLGERAAQTLRDAGAQAYLAAQPPAG
jgi:hydroxymethylbilane synthase